MPSFCALQEDKQEIVPRVRIVGYQLERMVNISPLRRRSPPRWPAAPNVICQTQTPPQELGANGTVTPAASGVQVTGTAPVQPCERALLYPTARFDIYFQ